MYSQKSLNPVLCYFDIAKFCLSKFYFNTGPTLDLEMFGARPTTQRHIPKDHRCKNGPALLVGRSRDRFPVVSLDFSVTYSFQPYHGPGFDTAPSENEYQEHFLEVKAAGA